MHRRLWDQRPRFRLKSWLTSLLAFGAFAMVSADVANLMAAHDRAIGMAHGETANLSQSLAEQAHGVFQSLDTILVGLRERVEMDGTGPVALQRLQKLLRLRVQALPLLHRLMVVDETGRVIVASSADAAGASLPSIAGRPVFLHHAADKDRSSFLGWPVMDHLDGSYVLPLSRRVDHADGSFAGVVVASVSAELFRQTFKGFDTGHEGVILLARDDGIAMTRWPVDPLGEARDLSKNLFFNKILRPVNRLDFEYTSMADGVDRLSSYYRVPGEPALVVVGRGRHEVLASWRATAAAHLAGLCVVVGVIVLLGRRLVGKIGEVERAQVVLTETNQRLAAWQERTRRAKAWLEMAEQIAQVGHWHVDFGGPWQAASTTPFEIVWSDELYRIHGLEKGSVRITPQMSIACYHPQDRAIVAAAMATAVREGSSCEFKARLVRPDGSIRHVLNRSVLELNAGGEVIGGFGVMMDVTEQTRSEAALQAAHADAEAANTSLEAANRTLEALVLQDSLTGLANRRCFDRALHTEFRREGRHARSLALIMIDVDHFKQFNDLYGHPAGDACLRSIAAVIPPLLRRPGDTAARYGGEEIAILLPGVTEDLALALAGRIVAAVHALRIPHEGSSHRVVTISAGVGAFLPILDGAVEGELVTRADMALYAAKRAGRNGVASFDDVSVGVPVQLRA